MTSNLRAGLILACGLICPDGGMAQDFCSMLDGAAVVANDGEFLGRIESAYSRESILNEYGPYGSEYRRTSIWNEYGPYGGEYSRLSPFNEYTGTPPLIILNGEAVAYLTVNRTLNGINPFALKACQ